MDRSTWQGRRVLVSGDTGFKGAWLTLWLRQLGAEVVGFGLPQPDPRAISTAVGATSLVDHHDLDVRDAAGVRALVEQSSPSVVFHLAGQALVRRGYANPVLTYETNVLGTVNVLDAVATSPGTDAAVIITSDKVYRPAQRGRAFVEDDALGGSDPYSTSKACAELVVAEWRNRVSVPVATARAGNVVGGGDRGGDRLIPDMVRSVEAAGTMAVRRPSATRPWQHVLDALWGYITLASSLLDGAAPAAVNFGPPSSASVADVLDRFVTALGSGRWTADAASSSDLAEAEALVLNVGQAARALSWRTTLSLDDTLEWTAAWYRTQLEGGDLIGYTLGQITRFEEIAMPALGHRG